jgi:hypothetical protein
MKLPIRIRLAVVYGNTSPVGAGTPRQVQLLARWSFSCAFRIVGAVYDRRSPQISAIRAVTDRATVMSNVKLPMSNVKLT